MKPIDIIKEKLEKNQDVLITVIGDSITWGLNHCNAEETYCAELARLFAERFPKSSIVRYDGIAEKENSNLVGYNGPIEISNGDMGKLVIVRCGVGGDTVRRTINRATDFIGNFIIGKKPDFYLVMLGINDSLKGDKSKHVTSERYFGDLKELYDILKSNSPQAHIVFMTPTYNDFGDSVYSSVEPYADMMKKLCVETGSYLIDTHRLWLDHLIVGTANYGQRDWLSGAEGDTCHFSVTGSKATAKYIFDELCEVEKDV